MVKKLRKVFSHQTDLEIFSELAKEKLERPKLKRRRPWRRSGASARKIAYNEYLKTPEWKRKRGKILKRDNYRCQQCGANRRLQVHHMAYSKEIGETPESDLITLCYRCHRERHSEHD